MFVKRNITMLVGAFCLVVFLSMATTAEAADTTSPLVAHVDDILQANPLKADEKVQMINFAQDDTISLFVVRSVEGHVIKKHFHKTHDEMVYVVKGTGQIFADDRWVILLTLA